MSREFELIEIVEVVENMAIGPRIRDRKRLVKQYGKGRWRKVKGIGRVRLKDGTVTLAERHWYEAHGLGRFDMRFKKKVR